MEVAESQQESRSSTKFSTRKRKQTRGRDKKHKCIFEDCTANVVSISRHLRQVHKLEIDEIRRLTKKKKQKKISTKKCMKCNFIGTRNNRHLIKK